MCPKLLKRLIGRAPSPSEDKSEPDAVFGMSEDEAEQRDEANQKKPASYRQKQSWRWSYIESEKKRLSTELESFNDNDNGTLNSNIDRAKDISDIYQKLHQLELEKKTVDYGDDISDIFTKLHDMELRMSDKNSLPGTPNGTSNNDALFRAQNDLYAKIAAVERQTEDLRLALQVHKCSAEIITDSVRYLHEKTIEMEELSQNSHSYESRIT